MRKQIRTSLLVLVLAAGMVLAACGPLPAGAEVQVNPGGQSAQVEFSGTVDSISSGQWSIAGQVVIVTPQSVIDGNIVAGDSVKVTATITADGKVTADRIEPFKPESASTPESSSDGKDPGSKDKSKEGEFVGVVTMIAAENWLVSSQSFEITSQTEIKSGILVGNTVKVHALINPDGTLTAREIELVKLEDMPALGLTSSELEMTGTVEAIAPDQWTVSGVAFAIDPSTEIKGSILVGDLVKVEASVKADGSLLVREIELADDSGDAAKPGSTPEVELDMEFTGVVTSIGTNTWVIGGKTFSITDQTEIKGTIVAGDKVKVEAFGSLDGTLTAREIKKVVDQESSVSTPGSEPGEDNHDGNSGSSTPEPEDSGGEGHGKNP